MPSAAPPMPANPSAQAAPKRESDCCNPKPQSDRLGDRLGLGLSALCAVHCIVTPALLILTPTLGQIWTDPSVHLILAVVVAPLAIVMTVRGYQRHNRAWVPVFAGVGVLLITGSLVMPAFGGDTTQAHCSACASTVSEADASSTSPTQPVFAQAGIDPGPESSSNTTSLIPQLTLHSALTLLGGLLLIAAHAGNGWLKPCTRNTPQSPIGRLKYTEQPDNAIRSIA